MREYINMKDKISISLIIIFGLALYALTLHGVWGNPGPKDIKGILDQPTKALELSPERGRYAHVYSLAENGTYALSQEWADTIYPDVAVYNGRYYSEFAPGISYMSAFLFRLGAPHDLGQVAAFSLIPMFALLALVCIYKIARNILELPVWASLFSAFVFGFASTSWSYAITLYQHQITASLALFSFYATWKFAKQTKWSFLWAIFVGLSYALSFTANYPDLILLLPVMVYFLTTVVRIHKEKINYTVS